MQKRVPRKLKQIPEQSELQSLIEEEIIPVKALMQEMENTLLSKD